MKTKLKLLLFTVAIAIVMQSCIKEEAVKPPYNGFKPQTINDDWQISTPAMEGMNADHLNEAYKLIYNNERFIMARSLLIIRNGKLVAEAYPNDPDDINRIENIQSCTKSFTSILTGIAFGQNYFDSLNQPLGSICPDYFSSHQDKNNITIKNALTMKTGINFVNGEHTEILYRTEQGSVDYILSISENYEPGIVFQYNDGAPHLMAAAIEEKYGGSLSDFADEFLFKQLGITDWKWESAHDGITFGAFSLFLKPRDLAKFGELLLNKGRWENQQVVDSTWISEATKAVVTVEGPGPCYGYYFWVYPAYEGFAAVGHGGQYIFVVPSKELVVIYTAWPYTSGEMFDNFGELADLIIKSCN